MIELSRIVSECSLWRTTLGDSQSHDNVEAREKLRSAFITFRDHAAHLAGRIARDVPELTVHDITHIDALWQLGSIIAGDGVMLTPTEAFVFGGAVLTHDLAMSIAAIDGGYDSIKKDPRWSDLIVFEYDAVFGRKPNVYELENPDPDVKTNVLFALLRQQHAQNAEKLCNMQFRTDDGYEAFLIEDSEIRVTLGDLIGKIAHSHWWPVSQIEREFSHTIGAPTWCPEAWTINPLTVASLLRLADAAHIDSRRAPRFLRAITQPSANSRTHWSFQQRLNLPYTSGDALRYTSGQSFPVVDADAWWLCFDTLQAADTEFRLVDELFDRRGYSRLAAKRIDGVDAPDRLAAYVKTEGWSPVNTTIHVTDIPAIIRRLGGEELYGRRPDVAIRELIQNACDAIRVRRCCQSRNADFGEIFIKLFQDDAGQHFLEISDNGVGMSQTIITKYLLNFGQSFWKSSDIINEFPGVLTSNIPLTGQYGIGFFSVFMIADKVQLTTRRLAAGPSETQVLEFSSGLHGRPILRLASTTEQIIDGGTRIKLLLKKPPHDRSGILGEVTVAESRPVTLADLCRTMCPSVDCNIYVSEHGTQELVIRASDWLRVDGSEIIRRTEPIQRKPRIDRSAADIAQFLKNAADNFRPIVEPDGTVVGRGIISIGQDIEHDLPGVVTVGGMAASILGGICGVLEGKSQNAARDVAIPIASCAAMKAWAEEQSQLIPSLWLTPEAQYNCARVVRSLGAHTGSLPIARHRGTWISANDIENMSNPPSVVLLLEASFIQFQLQLIDDYVLDDNVMITYCGSSSVVRYPVNYFWPQEAGVSVYETILSRTLASMIAESLCKNWGVPVNYKRIFDVTQRIGTASGRDVVTHAKRISKDEMANGGN